MILRITDNCQLSEGILMECNRDVDNMELKKLRSEWEKTDYFNPDESYDMMFQSFADFLYDNYDFMYVCADRVVEL